MRELVASYLSKSISRRGFLKALTKAGVSLAAAEAVLKSLTPLVQAQDARRTAPEGIKLFQGTGGRLLPSSLLRRASSTCSATPPAPMRIFTKPWLTGRSSNIY